MESRILRSQSEVKAQAKLVSTCFADTQAEAYSPKELAALRLWQYDADRLTLTYVNPEGKAWPHYEIDLERCRTSAAVLDWIMQVASKRWASDTIIAPRPCVQCRVAPSGKPLFIRS